MKKIMLMVLPVIAAMACPVWADDCRIPSPSVYSAPLAQAFIGYIKAALPGIQFNSTSQIIDKPAQTYKDDNGDVQLQTEDGTILDVTGTFEIEAVDSTDNEGNVTGCTLWIQSTTSTGGGAYIDGVVNRTSGHNILSAQRLPIGYGPGAFSLNIQYPYSQ